MKCFLLLLVLLGLAAHATAQSTRCVPGATRSAGCYQCANSAADADCEWCIDGYWKSGPKACTACPDGTGRNRPTSAVQTETNTVCTIKSAPQLKCAIASEGFNCTTCATGQYFESAILHGLDVTTKGCSTDCKSFDYRGIQQLVPNAETPAPATPKTSCTSCSDTNNCLKCKYAAATMKASSGATPGESNRGQSGQLTECTECGNAYYLKANTDATIVPSCAACGANCKKCTSPTACDTCYPGWALDGTDKGNCVKAVAVSGNIIKAALISILALFIAW